VEEFSAETVSRTSEVEKAREVSDLESDKNGKVIAGENAKSEETLSSGGIMTVDPVCGMKVDEKDAQFNTQFAGKKYSFCSQECKLEFESDPDQYANKTAAA